MSTFLAGLALATFLAIVIICQLFQISRHLVEANRLKRVDLDRRIEAPTKGWKT